MILLHCQCRQPSDPSNIMIRLQDLDCHCAEIIACHCHFIAQSCIQIGRRWCLERSGVHGRSEQGDTQTRRRDFLIPNFIVMQQPSSIFRSSVNQISLMFEMLAQPRIKRRPFYYRDRNSITNYRDLV